MDACCVRRRLFDKSERDSEWALDADGGEVTGVQPRGKGLNRESERWRMIPVGMKVVLRGNLQEIQSDCGATVAPRI